MNTQTYNGWTNYETWNAALWLDNDQGTQEFWIERAEDAMRAARMYDHDETFTIKQHAAFRLEEEIKDSFEEQASERCDARNKGADWMEDAINAYLSEVNWYEIAEHFLSDIEEEAEVTE